MKYTILLTLILLSACTAPYKPQEGNSNGYSDVQVDEDSFIVSFKGGAPLRTKELALLRSAEVCLTNFYRYFTVTQMDDLSTIHIHGSTFVPYGHLQYGDSYTVKKPHYVYTVVCSFERLSTPSYDARMVLENISDKHLIER